MFSFSEELGQKWAFFTRFCDDFLIYSPKIVDLESGKLRLRVWHENLEKNCVFLAILIDFEVFYLAKKCIEPLSVFGDSESALISRPL